MNEIELLYTKSTKKINFLSTLIMWYTQKPYSHVARRKYIDGEAIIYHAAEGKVHYVNESTFLSKNKIVKTQKIQVDSNIYKKMEKISWKQVGKSYGSMQNVGILISDILSKIGIKSTNPFKKGLNCSELIYRTVLKPLFPDLQYRADKIKPHDIEYIIKTK